MLHKIQPDRARIIRLVGMAALLGLLIGLLAFPVNQALAAPLAPMACADSTQASGAIARICMPVAWNNDLIVYAHGYVAANQPVAIPEDQLRLPDGSSIPDVANSLGYAFATTSYSVNGLAVRQGLADLVDLVSLFRAQHPTTNHVYLVGASEGGLITTLATELHPNVFSGGLASCGPIGDFRSQIDYVADFRTVFNYFFPGLAPGNAISVPQATIDTWPAYYTTTVLPAILNPASALSVTQVLSATGAVYNPMDTTTISSTFEQQLWYSVMATNDARVKLGGQPFDNMTHVYTGSLDDAALNAGVERFSAEPAALAELEAHYQTAGRPGVPLVTLHTTLDQTVPYWHETLYRAKIVAHNRTPRHDNMAVIRYGHCNFTSSETMQALILLQTRVLFPPQWKTLLPVMLKKQ